MTTDKIKEEQKEKKKKRIEQIKRWGQVKLSQKAFRNILTYMSTDFLNLICFMVVYRKFPYQFAYFRFQEALRFFDDVQCKNKVKLIEEYFFDCIETADEFWNRWLDHHYRDIKEPDCQDDTYYYNWQLSRYINDKEMPMYLSEDICKNVMSFFRLFMTAVKYPKKDILRDTDLWHYACEYLLMDDKEVQWFVFGPNGHNLLDLIEEKSDETTKS